jgi:hypothetical protein
VARAPDNPGPVSVTIGLATFPAIAPQPDRAIELSWPSDVGPLVLDSSESLAAGAHWASESNQVQVVEGRQTVRVEIREGSRFFRLPGYPTGP